MANYANLIASVQQSIKQNGNQEITGALLQQNLVAMISELGVGYQFMGIATPSSVPGTPDYNVCYFALTAGTYVNFGGIQIAEGESALIKYNGTWSKDTLGFATTEELQAITTALEDSIKSNEQNVLDNSTVLALDLMTTENIVTGKFISASGNEQSNAAFSYYKYPVIAGGIYAFSARISAAVTVNIWFIYWADSEGNIIKRDIFKHPANTNVVYDKQRMIAPEGAAFAYCNLQNLHIENNHAFYSATIVPVQNVSDKLNNLVVDNLTTNDPTKALAASQALVITKMIEDGDAADRRIIGNLSIAETKIENLVPVLGSIDKTDGSIRTDISEYWYHVSVELNNAARVRFLGNKYSKPDQWSSGYAFYDANGVCVQAYSFVRSADGTGVLEYTVNVPVGATVLKISLNTNRDDVVGPDNFYCYLQYGTTSEQMVKDTALCSANYIKREISDVYATPRWSLSLGPNGNYGTGTSFWHKRIIVIPGDIIHVKANAAYQNRIVFMRNLSVPVAGGPIGLFDNNSIFEIAAGEEKYITVPEGCYFAAFNCGQEASGWQYVPEIIEVYSTVHTDEPTPNNTPIEEFICNYSIQEASSSPTGYSVATGGSSSGRLFRVKAGQQYFISVVCSVWEDKTVRMGFVTRIPSISGTNTEVYQGSVYTIHSPNLRRLLTPNEDGFLMVSGSATFEVEVRNVTDMRGGVFDGTPNDSQRIDDVIDQTMEWQSIDNPASLMTRQNALSPTTGNYFASPSTYRHAIILLDGIKYVKIVANSENIAYFAWFTEDDESAAYLTPNYVEGTTITIIPAGKTVVLSVPEGANYMYVHGGDKSTLVYAPAYIGLSAGAGNENPQDNSIIHLYDNPEHLAKVRAITKPICSGRGNEDTHIDTSRPQPLVLLHFSDVHGYAVNFRRVLDYYQLYSDRIDDVIHTGDLVSDYFRQSISSLTSIPGYEKVLNLIGNHDTAEWEGGVFTDWSYYAGKQAYNKFIGPFIGNWGDSENPVVQPEDAETLGKCYYYKDYVSKGIRLIVLDNMVMTGTGGEAIPEGETERPQLTWFQSVLDDALTNELTVVIAIHFPNRGGVIDSSFSGYGQAEEGGEWAVAEIKKYFNAVHDFKESGGQFVCWMCGHVHSSTLGHAMNNYTDQLIIGVGSSVLDARSTWPRALGTKTQDFMHLMAVDTVRKNLRVLQVGVEYDAWMRHREAFSYNYETSTIIKMSE